uniref:Transmembrane protein 267 n=1 Tax=Caligus clemensi TaxID=344056 RepID=C1C3B7_CALCM|nr:C5orf28 homolog [Caligus clemensi]
MSATHFFNYSMGCVAILLTCLVGDYLTLYSLKTRLQRALVDSLTHGFVAGLSWFTAQAFMWEAPCGKEIVASWIIGSGIDVDHFIEGGSLSLKAATSLQTRPFLHNSLIPISLGSYL